MHFVLQPCNRIACGQALLEGGELILDLDERRAEIKGVSDKRKERQQEAKLSLRVGTILDLKRNKKQYLTIVTRNEAHKNWLLLAATDHVALFTSQLFHY